MFVLVSIFGVLVLVLMIFWFGLLTAADRHLIVQKPTLFESGGRERTYRIIVPGNVEANTKVIFVVDGFGGNGRRAGYYSAFHNVARDSIVVYPDPLSPKNGQIAGWNAGFCCGSGWLEKIDDKEFITSLASELSRTHSLSSDKFYVAGFSNGAFMAQRLAAEVPDRVNAVVSVAGTIGTNDQSLIPTAPVPILLIHGKNDQVVPFGGGARDSNPDFVWRSVAETEQAWKDTNENQAAVETYWHDSGHIWPGWRTFNVWNRRPEGSAKAMEFLNTL